MGQEIAIKPAQAVTAGNTETPFSITSLKAMVPDWLGEGLFEDIAYSMPAQIPSDGPRQLRDVAKRFRDSLDERAVREVIGHREDEEGKAHPLIADPLDNILAELRLRTTVRNESRQEAESRFKLLRDDCRPHCLEAIREGAKAYAKSNRFFPSGYGELLPYIGVAEGERQRTMSKLLDAAKRAEAELAERKRLADDPVDPAEVAAFVKEMESAAGMRDESAKRKDYSNLRKPSAEELAKVAAEFNSGRPA